MKNNKFRTKYPRQANDHQGSNTYGVSKTIPNETYTIRELLNKHTSGLMPEVGNEPIWQEEASHDSPDLQKLHRLDIVEKQIEQTRQTNIIEQLDEILEKAKQKTEQARTQKADAVEPTEGAPGGQAPTSSEQSNGTQ